ncbi:C2 domain-containing protein [Hordeum vulgare]|nr:C2 domain-containing protein [Hordeum vulgare]
MLTSAPSMPAPVTIDLNTTLMADGSSYRGMRKCQHEMPSNMLTDVRNLFDGMSVVVDDDTTNGFLENMIFEGAPSCKIRCFKPWRHSRFSTMTKPSISSIVGLSSTGRRSSRRNMPPSWRVGVNKLCRTMVIARRPGRGGGGEDQLKEEDRRYAASIALFEKVEGMINKKGLREEKRRQEKKEKMHTFMEIQRRRLEMDAKRQAKMLELEEAKQAKMLEIEATNARTKAKEVALASMKTGAEIMKVDLNTVSSRKRLWFEKM